MIPDAVLELRDYLAEEAQDLSTEFEDGRTNATINEKLLINLLKKKFKIKEPPPRHWWDIAHSDSEFTYPINIKVSNLRGNDNVQCKLGIYYALTGIWPEFPNEISWEAYFQKISEGIDTDKTKDYYFLIVNNENPADVIATSLKGISTLVPNGNNLPFQCKWGSNRHPVQRNHDDAKSFILGNLGSPVT